MPESIITYVPESEARRARVPFWHYVLTAAIAIGAHHLIQPHGKPLKGAPEQAYVLTRAGAGWIVETRDARGNVLIYSATSVTINADDHD